MDLDLHRYIVVKKGNITSHFCDFDIHFQGQAGTLKWSEIGFPCIFFFYSENILTKLA